VSEREHQYSTTLNWTDNRGSGTSTYRAYSRDHQIGGPDKAAAIDCSSDPEFRGDPAKYSPEELLIAALASCHMLWMLHLCADAGIIVNSYTDTSTGVMRENADGSGEFVQVTIRPRITLADVSRTPELNALHEQAHELCFIARSVNFPVRCDPVVVS
jgi:organic hydroperoxide reductase OsmC/OhrA